MKDPYLIDNANAKVRNPINDFDANFNRTVGTRLGYSPKDQYPNNQVRNFMNNSKNESREVNGANPMPKMRSSIAALSIVNGLNEFGNVYNETDHTQRQESNKYYIS